jgi:hypothetical protein
MTITRKCGKKTKSRVSRNKRNRRVSRKQKGGDRSAVLRKGGKDKDIKRYTLTKRGIEWIPGTGRSLKFWKGSKGLIRYSDIPSQESIRKVGNNIVEVETTYKTYIFDNQKPCKNNRTGDRCVGNISLYGFYKALVRKWTEHNTGISETPLETLARFDRETYGLDTREDYGLDTGEDYSLYGSLSDYGIDPIPDDDDDILAEFEAELRDEGSLRGGRKHKNKSRKSRKCRKTKKTRRTRKTRKARRKRRR